MRALLTYHSTSRQYLRAPSLSSPPNQSPPPSSSTNFAPEAIDQGSLSALYIPFGGREVSNPQERCGGGDRWKWKRRRPLEPARDGRDRCLGGRGAGRAFDFSALVLGFYVCVCVFRVLDMQPSGYTQRPRTAAPGPMQSFPPSCPLPLRGGRGCGWVGPMAEGKR